MIHVALQIQDTGDHCVSRSLLLRNLVDIYGRHQAVDRNIRVIKSVLRNEIHLHCCRAYLPT